MRECSENKHEQSECYDVSKINLEAQLLLLKEYLKINSFDERKGRSTFSQLYFTLFTWGQLKAGHCDCRPKPLT